MDPDPAFEDADPFAGLEARLVDSLDDDLSELDYARTDEQAQAELEATMDRLRRRAAQPVEPSEDAELEAHGEGAAPLQSRSVAASDPESRHHTDEGNDAGLRILDEALDLDVDYADTPAVAPAAAPRQPERARSKETESMKPVPGSTVPQNSLTTPDAGETADAAAGEEPLFVASATKDEAASAAKDEISAPSSTFGALVGSDDEDELASLTDVDADEPLLPTADDVEWGLDDLDLPGPSDGEDHLFTPGDAVLDDLDVDSAPVPETSPVEPSRPVAGATTPGLPADLVPSADLAGGADLLPESGLLPDADLVPDAKPIPGVRIPDTRLATPEQMAISDATPLPRLEKQSPDAEDKPEPLVLKTEDSTPVTPEDTEAIEHLIPDRERPPLLVYLLLTALTLAALGALLWYTNRSTTDAVTTGDAQAETQEPAAEVEAETGTQEQPAPAPPAGARMDDAINQIATAVDRCDQNGLLGTLRSSADVPVQVDLRLEFIDDAGQIYYTAERATGAIDPGQAVTFTFLLLGEPLDAQYVGVAPADCRFNITGVFGA